MDELVITQDNIDEIGFDEAVIVIERLADFDDVALNRLRWRLSDVPRDDEARIDGKQMSADAAVELLVIHLLGARTGARIQPDLTSRHQWAAIGTWDTPFGDNCYYIDGELEPIDRGVLFDRFEPAMYPDSDFGFDDDDDG